MCVHACIFFRLWVLVCRLDLVRVRALVYARSPANVSKFVKWRSVSGVKGERSDVTRNKHKG